MQLDSISAGMERSANESQIPVQFHGKWRDDDETAVATMTICAAAVEMMTTTDAPRSKNSVQTSRTKNSYDGHDDDDDNYDEDGKYQS